MKFTALILLIFIFASFRFPSETHEEKCHLRSYSHKNVSNITILVRDRHNVVCETKTNAKGDFHLYYSYSWGPCTHQSYCYVNSKKDTLLLKRYKYKLIEGQLYSDDAVYETTFYIP
jgi:hypothetical protein